MEGMARTLIVDHGSVITAIALGAYPPRRLKENNLPVVKIEGETYVRFDDLPIEYLRLGERAKNSLRRMGIRTIGELCTRNASDLLEQANFGHSSLAEVDMALQAHGRMLGDRVFDEEAADRVSEQRVQQEEELAEKLADIVERHD